MNNILKSYKNLKTAKEKRLFCLKLDKNKKYNKLLSYDKLSIFSINVCFENLTNIKVNETKQRRNINFNDEKTY